MPSIIMGQLFARCDKACIFRQGANFFAGDNGKIIQGPFAGTIGEIIDGDSGQRVHLLFDFMGQKSNLTVDSASVTPTM